MALNKYINNWTQTPDFCVIIILGIILMSHEHLLKIISVVIANNDMRFEQRGRFQKLYEFCIADFDAQNNLSLGYVQNLAGNV